MRVHLIPSMLTIALSLLLISPTHAQQRVNQKDQDTKLVAQYDTELVPLSLRDELRELLQDPTGEYLFAGSCSGTMLQCTIFQSDCYGICVPRLLPFPDCACVRRLSISSLSDLGAPQ